MTSHLALRVAFSLKIRRINYMSLSTWRVCAKVIEAIRSPGVGVTGGCESAAVGAGNGNLQRAIHILLTVKHLSSPMTAVTGDFFPLFIAESLS